MKTRYDLLDLAEIVESGGCLRCGKSGYQGVFPIFELLEVDRRLRVMIAQSTREDKLMRAAREQPGFCSLYEDVIRHVLLGDTTLDEVRRVVGELDQTRERSTSKRRSPWTRPTRIAFEGGPA